MESLNIDEESTNGTGSAKEIDHPKIKTL